MLTPGSPRKIITEIRELQELLPTWQGKKFAFDVETSGLSFRSDRLLGLALYFEDKRAYYIVLEHTVPLWSHHEAAVQRFIASKLFTLLMSSLFSQTDIVMIAHNAKFDMHFLHRNDVKVQGRLFDTLLAAQLLDENRRNDLKSLAASFGFVYEKYATLVKYRGYTKDEILGAPLHDVAQYAMNDVEATWKLYESFSQQLAQDGLEDVFNRIWMPLLPVLQQMEARGIALDLELVKKVREEYVETQKKLDLSIRQQSTKLVLKNYELTKIPGYYLVPATAEQIANAYENDEGILSTLDDGVETPVITYDMIGKTKSYRPRIVRFNTNSTIQMQELVYKWSNVRLPEGLPLKKTPKGDGLAVDKDNLETLIFYSAVDSVEYLREVLEWKKVEKFISTYLDRFLADADPTDHYAISTSFNQAVGETGAGGTATGRLSSNRPNLMNIPSRGIVGKQARSMFIARKGYKLIVADYSQMELRMLAHYSQDPVLLEAFEKGQDLHILTGAAFAQMTYEELKAWYDEGDGGEHYDKAKELRQLGKTGNFALTYGMGPRKFQRYLLVNNKYEITVEQAEEWINQYNQMFAVATEWKFRVSSYVKKHGHVLTIARRKRRLPEAYSNVRWIRMRAERQGVNAVIQGSCGDIICEAMTVIQPMLLAMGGSLLLQVHDELVAEVPEQYATVAAATMEQLMIGFINDRLTCKMRADAHTGDSWSAAKG